MIADGEWTGSLSRSRRATVAGIVFLLHVLAGLALFGPWADDSQPIVERAMDVLDLTPKPLAVERPRRVRHAQRRAGTAAPPNLKNVPTEVVAPPPVLRPIPVPVLAAPIAGPGSAADAGAAPVVGPGTGAGGKGAGRGGGGDGDGDGGDGIGPELIRGRLRNSDYPKGLGEEGVQGRVSVRYLVGEDGRVSDCEVIRSSGNKVLDATTCRLIIERFRFRPSRDGRGRPVAAYIVENHEWISQHD